MKDDLIVLTEVRIPLDRIIDAVTPQIHQALIKKSAPRLKMRPTNVALKNSIERVVAALDHLERMKRTVGEPAAHEALMAAVVGMRKAYILDGKD